MTLDEIIEFIGAEKGLPTKWFQDKYPTLYSDFQNKIKSIKEEEGLEDSDLDIVSYKMQEIAIDLVNLAAMESKS